MASPILIAVGDLFFSSKLDAAARALGISMRCLVTCEQVLETVSQEVPPLIVVDLDSVGGDPVSLVRNLKGNSKTQGIPIVGFLRHTSVELRQQALEAGCNEVLIRSTFVEVLPEILKSYADPRARS